MSGTPFAVFLASAAIIAGVFAAVALSTRKTQTVDYARATRLRIVFFASLAAILVTFLVLTLPHLPYTVDARAPDRIVHAVGKQYAWSLSEQNGPTLATWDREFSPSVTIPVRTAIEFRVTTLDVNHGFSVYSPDGHLIAQTQAMPGYMNRLRLSFEEPGTYTVLCLEFCGMSHHKMRGVIEVR